MLLFSREMVSMVKKLSFELRANRGARQAEIIKKPEDARNIWARA
jgi:hypothetical protein